MPYTIKKSKNKKDKRPYKIVNKTTKKVVGSSMTRKKAVGSMMHREDAMMKKGEMMKTKKVTNSKRKVGKKK